MHLLFRKYIWLVDTVREAGRISFSELNDRWLESELSEDMTMSRATFNRHRQEILEIFGIDIDCDRSEGNRYYIAGDGDFDCDSIQEWMLSTLSVGSLLSQSLSLKDRILLEHIPSANETLKQILQAMKKNVKIVVEHKKYGCDEITHRLVEPYCIKLFEKRWYLLGRTENALRIFSLDRIKSISQTEDRFRMDRNFNAERFCSDYFGAFVNTDVKPSAVVLRAFGNERFYMCDLPLHTSQKMIAENADSMDFLLFLAPTVDFVNCLVGKGERLKVLKPAWLADEVRRIHELAIGMYK